MRPLSPSVSARRDLITHPDSLVSRINLGYAHQSAGRTAEAIPFFEATLSERVLGADHSPT